MARKRDKIPANENWRNFLTAYRDLPELWDLRKGKECKEKESSYAKLLDAYRVIHKNATIEDLKERLMGFKRCYYTQLRKLLSYRKLGRKFEPTLWYFDLLKFLPGPKFRETQEDESIDEKINKKDRLPYNEAWHIFFDFYRGLPDLWDYTLIKDVRKKNQCLARLLDVYRMICEDATLEDLKKRLNSIKKSYRRQVAVTEEEKKKGNESYVPSLWYFDYVDFLSYPDAQVDPETQESCMVGVDEYGQILLNNEPVVKPTFEYSHTRPPITYEEAKKKLESYFENKAKEEARRAARKQRHESAPQIIAEYKKRRRVAPQICIDVSDSDDTLSADGIDDHDYTNDADFTPTRMTPIETRNKSFLRSVRENAPTISSYLTPFLAKQREGGILRKVVYCRPPAVLPSSSQPAREEKPQDEASAYGESWAASYRNLTSDTQKLYAKKAIEDILTLGQLDRLKVNTVDINSA